MSRYRGRRRRDDGLSSHQCQSAKCGALQLTLSSAARKTAIWTSALALPTDPSGLGDSRTVRS